MATRCEGVGVYRGPITNRKNYPILTAAADDSRGLIWAAEAFAILAESGGNVAICMSPSLMLAAKCLVPRCMLLAANEAMRQSKKRLESRLLAE